MKNKWKVLLIGFLVVTLLPVFSQAQTDPRKRFLKSSSPRSSSPRHSPRNYQKTSPTLKPKFYGELRAGVQHYKYEELPNVMSIATPYANPMYTLGGMIGVKFNPFLKMDLELYFSQDTKNIYEGSSRDLVTGILTPIILPSNDLYAGGVYRLGFIYGNGITEWATFYTGLGYRFLHNKIKGAGSYTRIQGYLYAPIGFRSSISLSQKIKLRFGGETRLMFFGHNTSYFTENGFNNDLKFRQNGGIGFRGNLGVEFVLKDDWSIFVQTFYDYWYIPSSNLQFALMDGRAPEPHHEPKNRTNAFGIEVGIAF